MDSLRVCVIGAGAVGSGCARQLAAGGHRVTLVEQFEVDHDRGSSWGSSRIIRKTYPDPLYTSLMRMAYPMWEALEREAGEPLFLRTGGLFFAPGDHPDLAAVRAALDDSAVPHEVLDPPAIE